MLPTWQTSPHSEAYRRKLLLAIAAIPYSQPGTTAACGDGGGKVLAREVNSIHHFDFRPGHH